MASSCAEAGDDESLFSISTQQRLEQQARIGGVSRSKKVELWQLAFTYYSMTSGKSSISIGFFGGFGRGAMSAENLYGVSASIVGS